MGAIDVVSDRQRVASSMIESGRGVFGGLSKSHSKSSLITTPLRTYVGFQDECEGSGG
jgi:hypothetical protein